MWSNPYKIEVMITSVIEVLQLPSFGHMKENFVGDVMDRDYDVIMLAEPKGGIT